jgi:hypothetical protein
MQAGSALSGRRVVFVIVLVIMVTRGATPVPWPRFDPDDDYTGDLIVNQEVGVAATPPAWRFLLTPREIPLRAAVPRMRLPNSGGDAGNEGSGAIPCIAGGAEGTNHGQLM